MRAVLGILLLAGLALAVLYHAGGGGFGSELPGGEVTPVALAASRVADRGARLAEGGANLGARDRRILFGDLHVHSSFSTDALQLALPGSGGDGIHPVADACDFARFCAELDFWSINDHANSLDARRWQATVDAVRQCDAVASRGAQRDLTSFLGWEWTQMGSTPENHYGHKNVILRDLDDARIPTRPIAAAPPAGVPSPFDVSRGGRMLQGVGAFALPGGHTLIRSMTELAASAPCASGVDVRELPADCREAVRTPGELFAKLDQWGHASMVIPHGTTWGMYTPPGSSYAKQLSPADHDPERQRLVEVYSGHGNSEEYRAYRAVEIAADGSRRCPAPTPDHLPSCWRAGEIIRERCLADAESEAECERRSVRARQDFVDADRNAGPRTIPGLRAYDLQDAGQCRDCFQPAFNYRPLGSVQYMLALSRPDEVPGARRLRFGFIAASDNHTARAGTGYKERVRREFTDARMAMVSFTSLVTSHQRPSVPYSERFEPGDPTPSVAFLEGERGGSFYLSGGLAAVHATSRARGDIWDALMRRETYGTSGPRILLWFDLLDPQAPSGAWPMGSEVRVSGTPTFRVRAAGSFEQKPGCAESTSSVLGPERLRFLCQNECYHPSDTRRPITRIEVVRIRAQRSPDEPVAGLIEDPWRVLPCVGGAEGCEVFVSDPEFAAAEQNTRYYVRAIEQASPTMAADPLGCQRDVSGACVSMDPCFARPAADDCLAPSEQRAWSSPIWVDFAGA